MSHEQLITLRYVDNAIRKVIAEVDISQFESRAAATEHLLKLLQADGFTCATDKNRLYVLGSDTTFEKCNQVPNHAVVFYSAVVAPNNAAEYHRENGIVYFFHSSEGPHLEWPHIHAKYSGEEISIYFNDFHTDGKLKNAKKEKEAIDYVKRNIKALTDKWNEIHGVPSYVSK